VHCQIGDWSRKEVRGYRENVLSKMLAMMEAMLLGSWEEERGARAAIRSTSSYKKIMGKRRRQRKDTGHSLSLEFRLAIR